MCLSPSSRLVQACSHGDGRDAKGQLQCSSPFQTSAFIIYANILWAKASHMVEARINGRAGNYTHGGQALQSYMVKGMDTQRMTNWATHTIYHSVEERKMTLMTTQ